MADKIFPWTEIVPEIEAEDDYIWDCVDTEITELPNIVSWCDPGQFISFARIIFSNRSELSITGNDFASTSNIVVDISSDANVECVIAAQADIVVDISSDAFLNNLFISQADIGINISSDADADRVIAAQVDTVFDISSDAFLNNLFTSQADIVVDISSDAGQEHQFASQVNITTAINSDIELNLAIVFVQAIGDGSSGSDTTLSAPAMTVSVGNAIIVCTSNYLPGGPPVRVSGIADTAGNTYTLAGTQEGGDGNHSQDMWIAHNISAHAANIVVVTFEASTSFRNLIVTEYSGLHLTDAFDAQSIGVITDGTSTLQSNDTAETDTADELVLGWLIGWNGNGELSTAGAYNMRSQAPDGSSGVADQIVDSTGTYDILVTCDAAFEYFVIVRTFRAQV
jgi:hypothetical protein